MIGQTISHYKIIEKLGAGGMGVVYKAQDTKLKRTVALKFLSSHLLPGKADKERFLREAQAAAALNHPNITHIYAIEEQQEQLFIVMEYIDGPSLEDMLTAPLPLEQALDIAGQIAAGLQAAHEQEVVHRDIKSANIMVDRKGVVKIMDFGLAKLANRSKLTQEGTTLGSAAYMSPEQANGDKVDARTDIWSLGVVLYEMISGQLPFKGDYEQAVIYAILNEDPEPLTALRTGVPMELERVVEKTLAKKSSERYQDLADLMVDLRSVQKNQIKKTDIPQSPRYSLTGPRRFSRILPWMVSVLMAILSVVLILWIWYGYQPADKAVTRFRIDLPPGTTLVETSPALAISPDGQTLIFAAMANDTSYLYLHRLEKNFAQQLSGTEDARAPFFSPDGAWIGFFAQGKMKKMALRGGNPQTICPANFTGAHWDQNGQIIFTQTWPEAGLWMVNEAGGEPVLLTESETTFRIGQQRYEWPQLLPNSEFIIASDHRGRVFAIKFGRSGQGSIITNGEFARLLPNGYLVYIISSDLFAAPFDVNKMKLSGSAVSILSEVMSLDGGAQYDFSQSGTFVYVQGRDTDAESKIVWVNRRGETDILPISPGWNAQARLSPDGNKFVLLRNIEKNRSIWIYNIKRNVLRRLTDEQGYESWPLWTPDGKTIIFNSTRQGSRALNLFSKPADGSGPEIRLTKSEYAHEPQSWTPDGNVLAITEVSHFSTGMDIWLLPLDQENDIQPLIKTKFNETHPCFSPDGKWLAYACDESGRYEVYVRPYPNKGDIIQISNAGGWEPLWSPDGKELFYRDVSGKQMMAVSINTGAGINVSKPRLLFQGKFIPGQPYGRYFDITKDGQRFLMSIPVGQDVRPRQINVVLNWFGEVEQLVSGELE